MGTTVGPELTARQTVEYVDFQACNKALLAMDGPNPDITSDTALNLTLPDARCEVVSTLSSCSAMLPTACGR